MLGATVKATGFALVVAGVIYVIFRVLAIETPFDPVVDYAIIDFWADVNTIRALAASG
jgi:hypothetical protein